MTAAVAAARATAVAARAAGPGAPAPWRRRGGRGAGVLAALPGPRPLLPLPVIAAMLVPGLGRGTIVAILPAAAAVVPIAAVGRAALPVAIAVPALPAPVVP